MKKVIALVAMIGGASSLAFADTNPTTPGSDKSNQPIMQPESPTPTDGNNNPSNSNTSSQNSSAADDGDDTAS